MGGYISPSRSYCLGKTSAPSMTTPKTKGKELIPSLPPYPVPKPVSSPGLTLSV